MYIPWPKLHQSHSSGSACQSVTGANQFPESYPKGSLGLGSLKDPMFPYNPAPLFAILSKEALAGGKTSSYTHCKHSLSPFRQEKGDLEMIINKSFWLFFNSFFFNEKAIAWLNFLRRSCFVSQIAIEPCLKGRGHKSAQTYLNK